MHAIDFWKPLMTEIKHYYVQIRKEALAATWANQNFTDLQNQIYYQGRPQTSCIIS